MKNFRIEINSRDKEESKVIEISGGQVLVFQRDQMDSYSSKHLKVQCIVRPSTRLETRVCYQDKFMQLTHAMIHETDPVKNPADWLTRNDDFVWKSMSSSIKNKRYKVRKKR